MTTHTIFSPIRSGKTFTLAIEVSYKTGLNAMDVLDCFSSSRATSYFISEDQGLACFLKRPQAGGRN